MWTSVNAHCLTHFNQRKSEEFIYIFILLLFATPSSSPQWTCVLVFNFVFLSSYPRNDFKRQTTDIELSLWVFVSLSHNFFILLLLPQIAWDPGDKVMKHFSSSSFSPLAHFTARVLMIYAQVIVSIDMEQ